MSTTAYEVRIEQIGADWWLHPETPPEQDMGKWLQQFYAHAEPLPDDYLADRQDPSTPTPKFARP
jgi:antitoxin VapB